MLNAGIIPQRKPYKIKKIFEFFKKQNVNIFPVELTDLSKIDFGVSNGMPNINSEPSHIISFETTKSNGIPILIIESPVIRSLPNIQHWIRFSWNSIFMDEGVHPYSNKNRWDHLSKKYNLNLRDWHQGENILFNLQIPTDSALNRLNFLSTGYLNFVLDTIDKIKKHTDRKLVVRPHPLSNSKMLESLKKIKNLEISNSSLLEDLNNAKVMVTYNSTSSVESIINGTPVISLDPSCVAYEVSGHNLDEIECDLYFDRKGWLNKISYMQWHIDELLDPSLWQLIKDSMPVKTV